MFFFRNWGQLEEAAQELKRSFLAKQLQVSENSSSERVPLLYGLISKYQRNVGIEASKMAIDKKLGAGASVESMRVRETPGNVAVGRSNLSGVDGNVLASNENILASGSQPNPFEFSNK